MSAELMTRAAALMRERANAATPGPWLNRRGPREHVVRADGGSVADTVWREDRRHIASWHPVVALAVADWLDEAAESWRLGTDLSLEALAVAQAYLGEGS
jgi:hypothetical protein